MAMQISSASFEHGQEIPAKHGCDGSDHSPPLAFSGVPDRAESLALIVDDPDAPDPAAPKMTWVHWLLYNLPADCAGLPEGLVSAGLPAGTGEGLNDWKRTGYRGPCPPVGRHRYFFRLFALDARLPELAQPTRAKLELAMQGHHLDEAVLMGTYRRS